MKIVQCYIEKQVDGEKVVSHVGEIDGIVYDASNNNVLLWIEMKAHAPDICKADKQREQFFKNVCF